MERLIFVCTSEVLVQFPLLAVEENVKADTPFTLLVADAPFMLDYAPTKTHWKCRARTIGEWPAMKNATLTMHKETGLVDLSREEAAAYLPHYFNLCRSLSAYAEAHTCRTAPGEAIALRLENGALTMQFLSGDARPPLLGVTLNGEYVAAKANWALVDVQGEAVEVLTAHAETGDLASIQALVALYTYGSAAVVKDAATLFHWQSMLAERGDKQAIEALALQYAHGYGVARDYTKAAEWMTKTGEAETAQAFLQNAEEVARAEADDAHAQAQLASTLLLQAPCFCKPESSTVPPWRQITVKPWIGLRKRQWQRTVLDCGFLPKPTKTALASTPTLNKPWTTTKKALNSVIPIAKLALRSISFTVTPACRMKPKPSPSQAKPPKPTTSTPCASSPTAT